MAGHGTPVMMLGFPCFSSVVNRMAQAMGKFWQVVTVWPSTKHAESWGFFDCSTVKALSASSACPKGPSTNRGLRSPTESSRNHHREGRKAVFRTRSQLCLTVLKNSGKGSCVSIVRAVSSSSVLSA